MAELRFVMRCFPGGGDRRAPPIANKKADVAEHRLVFIHVGLLVIEPPGEPGLP